MSFRLKLQYLLVKKLQISNKKAIEIIASKKVKINGIATNANPEIEPEDEVIFEKAIIKEKQEFSTYAFYKPRGIETTFNIEIADNLKEILPFSDDFFPIGRLDKASEGLLLISNDGRIYDKILRKEHQTEKEYLVKVDKIITQDFIEKMSNGIMIMGKMTLKCQVEKVSDHEFKIILTQGLNRQIRRMCYKLDYEVTQLIRTRIADIKLENLKPYEWKKIQ